LYDKLFSLKVSQDLFAIQITPRNDIVTEARSNLQTPETEILLYDIYVCLKLTVFYICIEINHI
jgi:hypothetical protein